MEMEELIRQITDSVVEKLKNEQKSVLPERAAPGIPEGSEGLRKIFDYTRMDAELPLKEAEAVAGLAKARSYRSVCLPQWLVASIAGISMGDTLLTTIVGLPGGKAMTQAKYAETKIAIQNGASGVVIPVNMELLANGIKEEAKLDLANAAVPAEGTGSLVIALVELGDISEERVFDALSIAESAGADEIRLSWILSGRPADREFITRFIRSSGLPVSVVGGISREGLAEVAASGVCGVGAGFEW